MTYVKPYQNILEQFWTNLKLWRIWLTDQSYLHIMLKVSYPFQPYIMFFLQCFSAETLKLVFFRKSPKKGNICSTKMLKAKQFQNIGLLYQSELALPTHSPLLPTDKFHVGCTCIRSWNVLNSSLEFCTNISISNLGLKWPVVIDTVRMYTSNNTISSVSMQEFFILQLKNS